MKIFRWLFLISAIALVVSCRSQQQQSAAPAGPVPVGTVREVMRGIVAPSADVLFNAVSTTISAAGVEDRQPRTDEEWELVQRGALTLVEAANLLVLPRRVAHPEEENTSAAPEELTPAEIQKKIDANREAWVKHVLQLQSVATQALKTTQARDPQALFDVGEHIEKACESCHMEFWYPDDVRPF